MAVRERWLLLPCTLHDRLYVPRIHEAFIKQLARIIDDKRKDDYSAVANYIRTKIRFSLLKSILISLRKKKKRGGRYLSFAAVK